jgi:hypothetical protein
MKRIVLVLALVITCRSPPTPVSATPNTKVDMVQDCSSGCAQPTDMAGPTGFGFVNFNQDNSGALRVVVSLKDAQPNTTYQIFLVCGPTHAAACGFTTIGTLTTNVVGNETLERSSYHQYIAGLPIWCGFQDRSHRSSGRRGDSAQVCMLSVVSTTRYQR